MRPEHAGGSVYNEVAILVLEPLRVEGARRLQDDFVLRDSYTVRASNPGLKRMLRDALADSCVNRTPYICGAELQEGS